MTNQIQLEVVRRITASIYCPPARPGDFIWVSPDAARHLLEAGVCKYIGRATPPDAMADGEGRMADVAPPAPARPLRRPDGWPIDRFSVVDPVWKGQTVVCIAGGPSLSAEQLELVRSARAAGRCRVIVVNDAYLVAPFADILYFADCGWWEWHNAGTAKKWPWVSFTKDQVREAFSAFPGQKCTIEPTGLRVADPEVHMLHNLGTQGLSEKPNALNTGANGGYQAVNLAALTAPARIVLVAYDMRYQNGRSHSHNGHPVRHGESVYLGYAKNFKSMVAQLARMGIRALNCTPKSAIDAFPRAELADVLAPAAS